MPIVADSKGSEEKMPLLHLQVFYIISNIHTQHIRIPVLNPNGVHCH